MKKLLFSFLLFVIITASNAQQCPDKPEWNFETGLECWTLTQNLSGSVSEGILTLTVLGNDPFMHSQTGLDLIAEDSWEIYMKMKNNTSDSSCQVYFTTATAGWSQDLSRSFDLVPNDTIFREYRIDMSIVPTWTGIIEQIRMDPVATVSSGSVEIDYIKVIGPVCEKQFITFPSIDNKTIYDGPFVLNASSTSGLRISYSLASGPALLLDSLVTLSGEEGVVVLEANQAGDSLYCPARQVNQVFFVSDTINTDTSTTYHFTDHWMVSDALGRTLPDREASGPVREDKLVGVFYYVWLGTHGQKVYDITEILKKPEAEREWGGVGSFHFWGEPEQGYSRSEDPWVIRRDMQMLANAKVDFIFFDVTNAVTYLDVIDEVCRISEEMRSEGIPTPDICFLTNASSGATMNKVFNQFYATGKYQDLWFFWDGKPLIMGHEDDPDLLPHVRDFFTIKYSWAWTDSKNQPNHWQWLDRFPQDYGWSESPDIPEQLSVSVAHHPGNPLGKSYHKEKQPPVNEDYSTDLTDYGYQFEEQWSRALEVDPQVVMITQWNEWIAQRAIWDKGSGTYGGRPIKNGDSYFVDVFSKEFNRDIAPMKGGYSDNYYYQMLSYIRQYKGMEEAQDFSAPKTIALDGDFSDWEEVGPVYEDPVGDVMHRNFRGYEAGTAFENYSGRNDILYTKVTYDADTLYFYAETRENITAWTDTLWMLLLLDVDRNVTTGWEGYDYIVNHGVETAALSSLRKWNGYEWVTKGQIQMSVSGNRIELSVPRVDMGMDESMPEFYFKWADNPLELNDITTFFMNGDAAPDRRFKYHFGTSVPETIPQSPYKDHQVPGTIQFEDFDLGSAGAAYVDADLENQGEQYRSEIAVDIALHADGEYYVGWTQSGEWLEYTMHVNAIGQFRIGLHYGSALGGQKALLYVNGQAVTDTITFGATGASDQWAVYDDILIRLSSGTKVLRFHILNARDDLNLNKMVISEEEVVYPGEGEGLFRSFWNAKAGGRGWFDDSICGVIDPMIDHSWEGSPGCGANESYWNARWEGELEALFSETYTLYLTMDDFGRVWVDNELLIDAWKGGVQGNTFTTSLDLLAGTRVPVQVDYAQAVGDGFIKLEWESVSHPREVIPAAQLFPTIPTNIADADPVPGDITIFPNPADNLVTIAWSGKGGHRNLSIFDLHGRKVYGATLLEEESHAIPLGTWQNGIYFVEIADSYERKIRKLIIR